MQKDEIKNVQPHDGNAVLNAGAVTFLPAIKPKRFGCLCCGSNVETHLPMDTVLYMGFGGWTITKDGEVFFMDDSDKEWEEYKTLEWIEKKAKRDPKHDWRAECFTPLHGETYQRQRGKWVLVEENAGFA